MIFSELSHTLAKIMINAMVAHTVLELLLIVMMLLRKCCGAASYTPARKLSSKASWQAAAGVKSKAVWVINSHTMLSPLPTLHDHRSQPLGSEESWNWRYNWQSLKSRTVSSCSQRDSEFSIIDIGNGFVIALELMWRTWIESGRAYCLVLLKKQVSRLSETGGELGFRDT